MAVVLLFLPGTANGVSQRDRGHAATAGEPVLEAERIDLRTRRSRTFRTADGDLYAKVFGDPVNYRDGGRWKPIDSTLVDSPLAGFAARNRANDWTVDLPAELSDRPVRVARDGVAVEFSLVGAQGRPRLQGATGRYAAALPGVDVRYDVLGAALKETLVLSSAAAGSRFRFDVGTSDGMSARESRDGGIEFVRGGEVEMVIPPPVVWDSAARAREVRRASFALRRSGDGYALTLTVDRRWLRAPGRRWPVFVDPYLYPAPTRDCTIKSNTPSSFCGASNLQVGWTGTEDHRTLFYFDVDAALPEQVNVLDAYVALYVLSKQSSTWKSMSMYPASRSWTTGVTWNTHDGTNSWTTAGGDFSTPSTDTSGAPGSTNIWSYWNVAGVTQQWADGDANHGLLFKDTTDQDVANVIGFASSDHATASLRPYMGIRYQPRIGLQRQYTYDEYEITDRGRMSVNVANGNLVVSNTDLQIAGRGLDAQVQRFYNSLSVDDNQIGRQWFLSPELHVDTMSGDHRVLNGPSGFSVRFVKQSGGGWKTPPGIDATYETGSFGERLTFRRSGERMYFNASGNLVKHEDRNGNHLDYTWAATGKLSSITDTQGRTHTVTYHGSGRMNDLIDSTGRYTSYDMTGSNLTGAWEQTGRMTLYRYDANGRMDQITDPRGNLIAIAYDSAGRVSSIKRVVDGTTTNDVTTTYDYSGATGLCASISGVVGKTEITDPRGNVTTYCWDKSSQVRRVVDDVGRVVSRSYTPNGDVNEFEEMPGTGNSALTTLTYDLSGSDPSNNLTKVERPAGEEAELDYHSSTSDPLARFRVRSVIDEQSADTFYGYDANGNLTDVKDHETTPRNRATLTYNGDGTIDTATDGRGKTTNFDYFSNGNLQRIIPPSPLGDTEFTYDALSRVETVTDGRGVVRTITYDLFDRVDMIEFSDGSWIEYCYDANGNLIEREDSAGNTTLYTYDKLNRRTNETFPGAVSNTYTYDKASNLKTVTGAGGTVTYDYDDANRVSSIVAPNGAGSGNDTVTYDYENPGDPPFRSQTFPGGSKQRIDFDLSGKPTLIDVLNSSGSSLRSLNYDYTEGTDQRALIQSITAQPSGRTTAYTYKDTTEDVGRLLKARTTDSGGLVEEFRYGYDEAGNRTRKHRETPSGTTTWSYAYDDANELCWRYTGTSSNACGNPPSGATVYTYDDEGNQETGDRTASYDAMGRTTAFGSSSLGYLTPTQGELVSFGSESFQNSLLGISRITKASSTTDIVRDPNGTPVSQRTGTAKRYFLQDHLASTMGFIDSAGGIGPTYTYAPDGEHSTSGSGFSTDILFAGGHRLSGPDLYHFGARYYDPLLARWTQPDPLNHFDDLREANRYAYAGGDPVNFVDPTGTKGVGYCPVGRTCKSGVRPATPAQKACTYGFFGGWLGDSGIRLMESRDLVSPKRWVRRAVGPWGCVVSVGLHYLGE